MSKKKNGDVIVYKATEEGQEVDYSALTAALEKSSLRQVAMATGVSYNMALKAIKSPVPGVPYDPDFINVAELEKVILKHMSEEEYLVFDWSVCAEKVAAVTSEAFVGSFKVGTEFQLRDGSMGEVNYLTSTHVVFTLRDTTKPQCMSFGTFEHQGARPIVAGEVAAE